MTITPHEPQIQPSFSLIPKIRTWLITGELNVPYLCYSFVVVIDLPDPPSPRPPSDHPLLGSGKLHVETVLFIWAS